MLNVGRWRSLLIARQTRNPVPNGCAATLGLLLFLAAIAGGPRRALAQSACPGFAASRWVGTLTLSGRGSTTVGDVSVTESVDVRMNLRLDQPDPTGCTWHGAQIDDVVINERLVSPCVAGGQEVHTVTYHGPSTDRFGLLPSLTIMNVPPFISRYSLGVGADINATYRDVGCEGGESTYTVSTRWIFERPPFQDGLPLPTSGSVISGNARIRRTGYSGIPMDATFSWRLTPEGRDDRIDDPCKANREGFAQTECENEAVAMDTPIVGTSVALHYASDDEPGRFGASSALTDFTRDLGGWTLNLRHFYDVSDGTLHLGDGGQRAPDLLGSPPMVNGRYLLASDDGSEVFEFDSTGRHLRTLDALTNAARYQFAYDGIGHLISITDFDNNVTTIQRDGTGQPSAIMGPYGQQTRLATNPGGYLTQITNPNGESVGMDYGAGGLLRSSSDPLGDADTFLYDARGLLTHAAHAGGASEDVAVSRSGDGEVVTSTSAAGLRTTYNLDFSSPGSLSKTITYPSGLQANVQRSSDSRAIAFPNGMRASTSFAPDPRWGIQTPIGSTQIATPGGLTRSTSASRTVNLADPANPLSLLSQADTVSLNGRTFTQNYTANNRTRVTTTPAGRSITSVLDAAGRISQRQAGGLSAANIAYDGRGRVSSVSQGSGLDARTTSFSYGTNGRISGMTDSLGRTASFTYDLAGRPINTATGDGRVIANTFDANGNRLSLTPPGRPAYSFTYTAANRLASFTSPSVGGGNQEQYAYNPDGHLLQITRADGQTLGFAYDNGGRLSRVTTPTQTRAYNYDAATGNLTGITGANADLAYGYDGDLVTSLAWTGAIAGTVRMTYNNDFRQTSFSVGSSSVAFQYDDDGFMVRAGDLSLTRDPQSGLLTTTALGSITDATSYNGFGEPVGCRASVNGTDVYSAQMTRDAGGRIATLTETVASSTATYAYAYDDAGRLLRVITNGAATVAYTYDSNGNRLSYSGPDGTLNASYDAQDRLLQYGTTSYSYTDSGELTSRTNERGTTRYSYDVLGNLTSVTLPDTTQVTYLVDGRNRRIGKRINGQLVQGFLYQDKLRPAAELDGAGNVARVFVYSLRAGAPDYLIQGGNTFRIVSDHLGSPRLVVNAATGQVVQQLDYDAFGNVLRDTNPGFQPFGFAGGLYDRDTRLLRFGARDYDPEIGRWTAKDPLRFRGGDTNLYAYVLNDPINLTDPTGHGWIRTVISHIAELFGKVAEIFGHEAEAVTTTTVDLGSSAAKGEPPNISETTIDVAMPGVSTLGPATNFLLKPENGLDVCTGLIAVESSGENELLEPRRAKIMKQIFANPNQ